MQGEVDQKQLAGLVTLLVRHGKVEEEKVYGKKDLWERGPDEERAETELVASAIRKRFSRADHECFRKSYATALGTRNIGRSRNLPFRLIRADGAVQHRLAVRFHSTGET